MMARHAGICGEREYRKNLETLGLKNYLSALFAFHCVGQLYTVMGSIPIGAGKYNGVAVSLLFFHLRCLP